MSLFCWTQRKIFWRMWETEQFCGTIDFHSFFSYYGSQWCPKTAWLQKSFFKISSSVFCRTKKFIQVWNYLRVSKWWQNFHFWVNYPFKHCFCKLALYQAPFWYITTTFYSKINLCTITSSFTLKICLITDIKWVANRFSFWLQSIILNWVCIKRWIKDPKRVVRRCWQCKGWKDRKWYHSRLKSNMTSARPSGL